MNAVIDAGAPLLLIVVAAAYALRVRTLADRERPVPLWRQGSFAAGILLLLVSDLPPLSNVAEEIVVAHMVQHLLIGDLAALFIVLGLTGPLLQPMLARRPFAGCACSATRWSRCRSGRSTSTSGTSRRSTTGSSTARCCTSPSTPASSPSGCAMWLPLVGPLPKPAWFGDGAKLVYVIVVRLLEAVLANVLIWSGTVLYPTTRRARRSGTSARSPTRARPAT